MALTGWMSNKGGSVSANSIAMMPRDQTSQDFVYGLSCSQAITWRVNK
ncbi:hypothetical protein TNCT_428421, partial [Trichonephila clavata]